MTVNKNTKTGKKKHSATTSTSASATTSSSTTQQKTSKSSKVASSSTSKSETSGAVSKSSSASSLQISDISHLPVNTNIVSYTVTEMLPTGSGEKITVYGEGGATSTEYRHFVSQDTSSKAHNTSIQQISSTLNESMSNLSTASGSTYTVTEPRDEFKLTYNKNDSGWNGKFIVEEPQTPKGKQHGKQIIKDGGTVVEQSSSSTSHQESSSIAKSSSSSYVIEIVDGKERIVDQKHHESANAQSSSNDEYLASRSGTNITPEVHYKQKAKESASSYDTAVPELKQPKGYTSESQREVHQIGDNVSSTQSRTHDNVATLLSHDSKHSLTDKTKDFINSETIDTNIKSSQLLTGTSSDVQGSSQKQRLVKNIDTSKNLGRTDTSTITNSKKHDTNIKSSQVVSDMSKNVQKSTTEQTSATNIETSENLGQSETVTTTYTYYDSKGNVIKTLTDVETHNIPGSSTQNISSTNLSSTDTKHDNISEHSRRNTYYVDESHIDTQNIRSSQTTTDSKNFYGSDSKDTGVIRKSTSPTRRSSDRDKRLESPSRRGPKDTSTPMKQRPTEKSPTRRPQGDITDSRTTYYVNENYVDTNKIRQSETTTDTGDFYGHTVDSKNTMVKNTYDSKATQNTIGTSGKILMDHSIDSTDIIYSNDRLYGKSGWNGHFTYETPQPKKPSDKTSPQQKSKDQTKADSPTRKSPTDKQRRPEESPTRKSPGDKSRYPEPSPTRGGPKGPKTTKDFLGTEIQENVNQFTDVTQTGDVGSKTTYYVDENYVDTNKMRQTQTTTDTGDFYGHTVDSKNTMVKNTYDSKATQNTIGTSGKILMDHSIDSTDIIYSNDRLYGKSGWNGHFTYETPQPKKPSDKTSPQQKSRDQPKADSPTRKSPTDKQRRPEESPTRKSPGDKSRYPETSPTRRGPKGPKTTKDFLSTEIQENVNQFTDVTQTGDVGSKTTYYVDENYVDTNKIRQTQTATDSKNFYGRTVDSKNTVVENIYDSKATQNTIGTTGKVLKDHVTDSTDIIYSNDRLYGKSGWNGKFTYETPQPKKPSDRRSPQRKPKDQPRTDSPSRKSPSDKPRRPGDSPTRSPSDKSRRPDDSPTRRSPRGPKDTTDFTTTDIIDTVNQFSDITDSKTTVTRDSKTFIDTKYITSSDSTVINENYVIIDGRRVPRGPKPGDTNYITSSDSTVINENYVIIDGQKVPRGTKPGDKVTPVDRKDFPTRDSKTFVDSKFTTSSDSTVINENYVIIDGQKVPRGPRPGDKITPVGSKDFPVTDSKTVVETFETVSKFSDSKTSVTKDSQTFVDNQSSVEHYTTHDTWDSSKPKGPKEPRGPEELKGPRGPKGPEESQGPRGPKGPEESKGPRRPKGPDESKGPRGPKDSEEPKGPRGPKGPEEPKEPRGPKDSEEPKGPRGRKGPEEPKGPRGPKDSEEPNEPRGPKGPEEPKGPRGPKGPEEPTESKEPKRPTDSDKYTTDIVDIVVKDTKVTDVTNLTEDVRFQTTVDQKFTTEKIYETDVKKVDKIVKDVRSYDSVDRVNKTFIEENIVDIKDINEIENITNIKKVTDNKVINIVKTIKEKAEPVKLKVPLKEQCICELCTCGCLMKVKS